MKFFQKKPTVLLMAVLAAVFLAGCGSVAQEKKDAGTSSPPGQKTPLFAYVGAGLKEPVSEIAGIYEQKTGVKVEMTFNNSGVLLSQLETSKKGDIYMPGGMPFVEMARQKGHIAETVGPIAYHVPVIVTPKGNPAKITRVQDLANSGVKLIMPDKEATAVGKSAFKMFVNLGIAGNVEKNIIVYVETAPKVLTALTMGQGNAGIAEYSNVSSNLEKFDLIEIDPSINVIDQFPCALLNESTQKEQAGDFLKFMQEEGPAVFAKYGFKTKL